MVTSIEDWSIYYDLKCRHEMMIGSNCFKLLACIAMINVVSVMGKRSGCGCVSFGRRNSDDSLEEDSLISRKRVTKFFENLPSPNHFIRKIMRTYFPGGEPNPKFYKVAYSCNRNITADVNHLETMLSKAYHELTKSSCCGSTFRAFKAMFYDRIHSYVQDVIYATDRFSQSMMGCLIPRYTTEDIDMVDTMYRMQALCPVREFLDDITMALNIPLQDIFKDISIQKRLKMVKDQIVFVE